MMEFKKRILTIVFLVLTFIISVVAYIFGQSVTTVNAASTSDLIFTELSNGTYSVKAKNTSISGDLVIPSSVNGKSVTAIAYKGFSGCTELTSITIPDSVVTVDKYMCEGCSGLTNVVIGNGITKITNNMFTGCSSLNNITLGNNVCEIGNNAFNNCISLASINMPEGILTIGDFAFNGCTSLKSITLPNTIKSIGSCAFYTCSQLAVINYAGTSLQWSDVATYFRSYNPDVSKVFCLGDIPNTILTGLEDYAFTNGNVKVSYSGYYAQAYYVKSKTGFPTEQASNVFGLGTIFSLEGYYRVEVRNQYAETVIKYFCIDKTPPVGTLTGVSNGGGTNSDVSFSWTDSSATAILDGNNYASGSQISTEGDHTIVLTDLATNSTSYSFTIDKTPPTISGNPQYANSAFTLTAQDKYSGVKEWEYKLNNGASNKKSGQKLTLGDGESANGVWQIRVSDELGNCSAWVSVTFAYRKEFDNFETAYNSYFVPAYYCVTLPQKNYPDCYGTYEFANYEGALKFATEKEWSYRVIELNGGKEWNYVTVSNENARQIYTVRAELDAAIDKYARKNISERKIMGRSGATLTRPTDDDGVTREDALTCQIKALPQILSQYASYRFMLIPEDYIFSTPKTIAEGNIATMKVKFISDGISLRESSFITLAYGDKLNTVATEQGWYLIEESDVCGNIERYLVYVDLEQPLINAVVAYGNGNSKTINFNETFIAENTNAMRYVSFDINSLSDNIDDFVMLILDGRGLSDAQYLWGDTLPVLCYENGYSGEYTVTVYDRSLNVLEFVVYIAGEVPTITHSSLSNETSCTFTIRVNDSRNEIKSVELYKVHYDGAQERLYEDSIGTSVGADNLVYKLTVGGKYVFVVTDLYGRVVSTGPIFYIKGLPTATLKGVKDGGITKNDVNVTFESTCTAELYVFSNGEWIMTDSYTLVESASHKTLSINAGAETTACYKVLLYVTEDKNLFTEYTFEIDGIPPIVEISTATGEVVYADTVTTQSFRVSWEESGYIIFYRKGNALSDSSYSKGTLITSAGSYTFTVYDSVRNEITFTVTLDNTVAYTLEGTYQTLDNGSLITRNSFVFTMLEPWSLFNVESSNGLSIGNGQKIDTDGTYKISVKDAYGNPLSMTLIVDKLPPVPTITTESGRVLSDSAFINEGFTVSCAEENVNITYAVDISYTAYDGSLITEAGTYKFTLTDRVGNYIDIQVVIDKTVDFKVNGTYLVEEDGSYLSGSWISITLKEEMTEFNIVSSDGARFEADERISSTGIYKVYMKDISGNEQSIVLKVDKLAPTPKVTTESGKVFSNNAKINEGFTVSCAEENVKIAIYIDGERKVYDGSLITEAGTYSFTLTDKIGNVAELTIVIDRVVAYRINGTYVTDLIGNFMSKDWLSLTLTEEMADSYIVTAEGTVLGIDERVSSVGEYEVYLKDACGNETSFKLIIDKTPPEIKLNGVLSGGVTNGNVSVELFDYGEAYYRLNGGVKTPIENGFQFDEEGSYTVIALDLVGNSLTATFEIDRTVDVTPSRDIVDGQIITGAISFEFGESVTAVLYKNGNENGYSRGMIAEVGTYSLAVTDDCQNVKLFSWTIVAARAKEYSIAVANYSVEVERNGLFYDAERNRELLNLTELGKYTLTFYQGYECWSIELEVDNLAPTVQFKNASKSITIFDPSKENVTYELYRDGKKVDFKFKTSAELTKKGNYTLICTDDLGNTTEYNVTLNYTSTSTIVLISILIILAVAVIIAFLILRFRRKKY